MSTDLNVEDVPPIPPGPYTLDPEELLVVEGVAGPVPLIADHYDDEPDYEVELEMDPDGYWFGVARDWSFTVESTDPGYPPRRVLRQMVEQTTVEWAQRETTVSVERHLQQIYQPTLLRRDRITARSSDGERTIILTRFNIERLSTPERSGTP